MTNIIKWTRHLTWIGTETNTQKKQVPNQNCKKKNANSELFKDLPTVCLCKNNDVYNEWKAKRNAYNDLNGALAISSGRIKNYIHYLVILNIRSLLHFDQFLAIRRCMICIYWGCVCYWCNRLVSACENGQ